MGMGRLPLALLAAAVLLAGCGGTDNSAKDPASQVPATGGLREKVRSAQSVTAADFPATGGRTLQEVANSVGTAGPELGMATKTTSAAHTGKWSVSLTNTGKTSAGSPSYRVAPITPVQPAQKWHAEVWARGNGTTGASQIAVSWFDINDKWLGGSSSASLANGTTGWIKLTVDGVAPAGSASMQIHLKSGGNSGTVWFDDVVMTAS